jgi:hypothetical protein
VDPDFQSQLLNCVNTVLCHRLNDEESAKAISGWIGTRDCYDITAQIGLNSKETTLGSANKNKAFIVHPECIKRELQTGECFYVSKINGGNIVKLRIKYLSSVSFSN